MFGNGETNIEAVKGRPRRRTKKWKLRQARGAGKETGKRKETGTWRSTRRQTMRLMLHTIFGFCFKTPDGSAFADKCAGIFCNKPQKT